MKKQWFLIGTILLVPWLVLGCGIPQEKYDSVVSDLNKAQQELQTAQAKSQELTTSLGKSQAEVKETQTKYETTQARASELTASLEKSQTELRETKSKLEAIQKEQTSFKSELTKAWNRFDKIAALEWQLVHYWSDAAKNDKDQVYQDHTKMITYVEPIGDTQLSTLWQQALTAEKNNQSTLYMESLAALMDRNNSLFNTQAKLVRDMLK